MLPYIPRYALAFTEGQVNTESICHSTTIVLMPILPTAQAYLDSKLIAPSI